MIYLISDFSLGMLPFNERNFTKPIIDKITIEQIDKTIQSNPFVNAIKSIGTNHILSQWLSIPIGESVIFNFELFNKDKLIVISNIRSKGFLLPHRHDMECYQVKIHY